MGRVAHSFALFVNEWGCGVLYICLTLRFWLFYHKRAFLKGREIVAASGAEQRTAMVAAGGKKVKMVDFVTAFETCRHQTTL